MTSPLQLAQDILKKCKIQGCTNTSIDSYSRDEKYLKYSEYCRKHYNLARKPLIIKGVSND